MCKVASHTCLGALVMNIKMLGLVVEVRKEIMLVYGLHLKNITPFIYLVGALVAKLFVIDFMHARDAVIEVEGEWYLLTKLGYYRLYT